MAPKLIRTVRRRTIAIPAFIFEDDELVKLIEKLTSVANELEPESGTDVESRAAVEQLLEELDRRGSTYKLVDGKITRTP